MSPVQEALAVAERQRDVAETVAAEAMRLMSDDQLRALRRVLGGQASGEELTSVNSSPILGP